jgi:cell division transport system permease protein
VRTWLRLHALALRAALARMAAQPWGAAMSVGVLGVALALPILAAVLLRSAGTVTAALDTEPHANVFLALDASDEEAKRVGDALRAHPEASSVRFVSRTQALEELKATTHLAELLAAIDRNPLPHAFTVRLRSPDPARLEAAREAWAKLPKVDQVASDFEWAHRLARWIRLGDRLLAGVAIALSAAVAFIVGHLIRLQVLTRREEIQVSQLIGATGADVRRPFLYHGALQGAGAGLAGLGLGALATAWIGYELSALTPSYAAELKSVFLSPREAGVVVAAAALLGLAGSFFAVHRELTRFSAAP